MTSQALDTAAEEVQGTAVPATASAAAPSAAASVLRLHAGAGNRAVAGLMRTRRGVPAGGGALLSRTPDGAEAAIQGKAAGVTAEAEELAEDLDEDEEPPTKPDPSEKAALKAEQSGNFAQPDKVSGPASQTEQAASQTQSEVAAPPEPVGEKDAVGPEGKEAKAPAGPAEAAAMAAQAAVGEAMALTEPAPPPPVEPVEVVMPVNSVGEPLPVDPVGEVAVQQVAQQVAQLRFGAHSLGVDAISNRGRAHALRAGIIEAKGKIDESAGSIETVKGHVEHRKGVVEQAGTALESSQEKAETVAAGAPDVASQADEGKASSGPMASESQGLASGGPTPDDEEAAEKAQEQGGQISEVSGSLGSIDGAIGQTGERARSLQADADAAKAKNAETGATITAATAQIAQTDGKLAELTTQNDAARSQVGAIESRPAELTEGAAGQEAQAAEVLGRSHQLEARLASVQRSYGEQLAAAPVRTPLPDELHEMAEAAGYGGVGATGLPIARTPVPQRERFEQAGRWAAWISNDEQTQEEQLRHAEEARAARQAELDQINSECGGDFSRLDTGQKAGLALRLTFSRTFGGLAATNWPKFGGDLLRGFVDPRVSLSGIVTGLGMIASGGANLFSAEQWAADPLGNLLKSAADIATGVTVVLGSIAGLAVAVIAISAALILFSWGFLAPVFLPVIAFCSTVAATVGPWAVTAAEVALVLNGLVFIKNLIDAATASTAEELQSESTAMGEDVNAMGMAAMQIAGDKVGEVVGPRVAGALEGVESRLASSGTLIGTNMAENMGKIGTAMAEGQARAHGAGLPEGAAVADAPAPAAEAPPVADAPAPVAEPAPTAEPAPATEPAPANEPGRGPDGEPLEIHDGEPIVADAPSPDGTGKARITEQGECIVCASPCAEVHERFPDAMEEPELAGKVEEAMAMEDTQAQAEAVAEAIPELKEAQSNLERINELKERMRELGAPEENLGMLDELDPASPQTAEQLAEIERLMEGRETGDVTLGEVTGELEAARKATKTLEAEILEANKVAGSAAEVAVADAIHGGEVIPELGTTATLVGSQVRVQTRAGPRIIDHVVELPTGEIVALEVKAGGATRKPSQIVCDDLIEAEGGFYQGTETPFPAIRTVVVQR